MDALLRFLKTYEPIFYLLLGVVFLLNLQRFLESWRTLQGAVFGLERQVAQQRLRQAFGLMALAVLLSLSIFAFTTFARPELVLTATAAPGAEAATEATTPTAELPTPTPTRLPPPELDTGGCVEGQVFITAPKNGAIVGGKVDIEGTANIPNFGFYKVEFAPANEALFLTIAVRRAPLTEGTLVSAWDTTRLPEGDYILQLVVTDNEGNALPPCRVRIHIVPPTPAP